MSTAFSGISPQTYSVHTRASSPWKALKRRQTHMQKEMVLENPLNGFQEIGPQRQRVFQSFLAFPEELGQHLVPHALG